MFALLLCQVKILPSIFELHFFILLVSSCSSEHTQCANQLGLQSTVTYSIIPTIFQKLFLVCFCVTLRGMLTCFQHY